VKQLDKLTRLARIFYNYQTRQTTLPYLPIRLWVESTNSCNLKCEFCPNATDTTSIRGNMNMDLYRKIIQEVSGKANDINLSHRGEPLFHPELEEMIAIARENGLASRIHTNATRLDAERARSLLDSAPDLISFSFDGFDKETYEALRVGAVFEETMANIQYFFQEKRRRGAGKPYTVIQIIEPWDVTDEYRTKLASFGEEIKQAGLDKFYIKRPHNWAGNAPGEIPLANEFHPCTFLYYSMTVLWDGTVCPCPQDWYGSMPLGNLNNQSIAEVWNGEPMVSMRKRMHRKDLCGLLCENCDRVFRKNVCGIPTENVKAFLGETLAGYSLVRKIIRK